MKRAGKGHHRIARIKQDQEVWATLLQTPLIAERVAALSGATGFVMVLTLTYTRTRSSEAVGLIPGCVHGDTIDIHWKFYELNGRFYRGRPKDGSVRTANLPLSSAR